MNYIEIYKTDTTNGHGIRVVFWTAGCSHHCYNCHNPQTWNPNAGKLYTDEVKDEVIEALNKPYIEGITFSGGDPMYVGNVDEVYELILYIRKLLPNKNIWLYTGFTYEEIMNSEDEVMKKRQNIIRNIDVLIDGKFVEDLKNLNLKWRGSSNQRVIDVKETLKNNRIVLKED